MRSLAGIVVAIGVAIGGPAPAAWAQGVDLDAIPGPAPVPAPAQTQATLPSPVPPPAVAVAVPAARAVAFAERYLALWSAPNPEALSAMSRSYAETVDFYGKPISRAALLAQKRSYMQRWPVRTYVAQPGSVTATCDAAGRACTVTGLLTWDCRSAERNAHSTGTASFKMSVVWPGADPAIVAESGAVVSRASP